MLLCAAQSEPFVDNSIVSHGVRSRLMGSACHAHRWQSAALDHLPVTLHTRSWNRHLAKSQQLVRPLKVLLLLPMLRQTVCDCP